MTTVVEAPQAAPAPAIEPGSADDLARYRRWVTAFEENKRDEQEEARLARKYYHDKQWSDQELAVLKKRKQHAVVDNTIKRKIDFLVGVEQRMRRDPKAYPRTPQHEHDADTATAAIRFVCDQNRWDSLSSQVMHDGLVSGIGVGWNGIEPGRSGNDVAVKVCDPARFIYDPRSTKPDFSDARWMGVDLWVDIDEAVEQHPEHADALKQRIDNGKGAITARPAEIDQAEQWGDLEHRRVRVVELYEKRIVPPYNEAVWTYCKFSGDISLDAMISPYQDEAGRPDNPYDAWSPYVDEMGNRYGVGRTMKSLQDSINHKRSRVDHEVRNRQTFSNRGGAVGDVDKLKEEINKPDGHLEFPGGEWGKDVGIIDRSMQIRGYMDLLAGDQARLENYGPNPGLLGKGPGMADSSGRALLAQRDSGMTELSPVFERHRDWKLRMFRSMWARVRQAWTAERWIAVTDDPRAVQFIPINKFAMDPETGRIVSENVVAEMDVDIILDEGPDTIIMREELMQTLANLGEAATGPLGKVMIELSNCPQKDQLIEMMDKAAAPPPEMVELQARMAKLEELLQAAKIDETIAAAEQKRADALSKMVSVAAPPEAMGAFPLNYGRPTHEQMASFSPPPGGQPGQDEGPMPGLPPPDANAMNSPTGPFPPMEPGLAPVQ